MRTEVHITAHPDGRQVFDASGALAVRQTGPHTLHLASTAAGPLGGDTTTLAVHVLRGARLQVHTVAATVVLPGSSRTRWEVHVEDGGKLALLPEPTVITARAEHRSEVRAHLHTGATLLLTERVQLGRAQERAGRWTGLLHLDRDGRPLLRHEVKLGPGSPGHDQLATPRALVSTLRVPHSQAAAICGTTVLLPLAGGGTLSTELKARL